MCSISFGWCHLVNAYGVKSGWSCGWQVKLCDPVNTCHSVVLRDCLGRKYLILYFYFPSNRSARISPTCGMAPCLVCSALLFFSPSGIAMPKGLCLADVAVFYLFLNCSLGDQLSQNVRDRASPHFQRRYACGWARSI